MSKFNHNGIESLCAEMLVGTQTMFKQTGLELQHIKFCWEYITREIMSKCVHMNQYDKRVLSELLRDAFDERIVYLLVLVENKNILFKTYYVVFQLLGKVRVSFERYLYNRELPASAELSMYIYEEAVYNTIVELNYNATRLAA